MKNSSITFLVQGPIREKTRDSLRSIRTFFPGASIILSTWKGEDISHLDYDELTLNDDPGGLNIFLDGDVVSTENTNRQIQSVSNAISHVTTQYCVKSRTDIEFTNDKFVKFYLENVNKYSRDTSFSNLSQRVLISSINTPNPNCFLQYVCQVSDWFYFGLTEDLKKIWEQELIEQSDFYHNEDNIPDREYKNGFLFGRFSAEQIITRGFLSKHHKVLPKYFRDENFIDFTNRFIASEFISAEPVRIGFTFLKYKDYCAPSFKCLRSLKGYIAFYSLTINYVRWNQICLEFMEHKKGSVSHRVHEKLCRLIAIYVKKKIYKI
ncbi:Wave lipopolysaccharide synthesis [Vibrio crassostreae]|uniref:WavE lipopolysaccharide synthesis family protein n=1 Tax=Vibrio crassostreae TaxID=246167 RepID=UPI001B3162D5|nr:WavE lipopolysaccharide synthesis family protein [Vibrio crassostreae]CAK2025340.1 Wave lipopolysaccharide synthesis [Vibrio crassostreae]CAK2027294.1 Wave lipopolysaccharide synthesis [Vibrio crassostreae]CAK2029152.1 Wave lipopolysaccharide synthesis [Vibrio crassostreae]CAK2029677.1 Wave lipopolysaccharide synthesis [Vibrio crassostreae]CAK2035067.1 Wave lipopolysaccharide synthesis [Vibrio crassostreae]